MRMWTLAVFARSVIRSRIYRRVYWYKDDLIIAYSELEKHGVETTMTGKEVDEMLKDVFKG